MNHLQVSRARRQKPLVARKGHAAEEVSNLNIQNIGERK